MSYWGIVLPEATTNYILNPSMAANVTDDWTTGVAPAAARVTTHRMFGLASMAITAAAAGTDAVTRTTAAYALANGATATVSVYAYRATSTPTGGIYLRNDTGGTVEKASDTISQTGQWERLTATWTNDTGSPADIRLLLKNTTRDGASIIYFDGAQLEVKAYATTFCDGSQPGCYWNGLPNNGTSSRPASTREGGRVIDLADYAAYIENVGRGLGMPTMRHFTSPRALLPGAYFQRRQVDPQSLEMTVIGIGTSRNNLHSLRKDLIDAVKPDLVDGDPEFAVQYQGSLSTKLPVELKVRYDSGLEWNPPDGFTQYIPLRLIAYDPFWYEQGNDAATVATESSLADSSYILQMDIATGVWSTVGDGALNGTVRTLMVGASGYWLYAGGDFTTFGATTCNYIARMNRSTNAWSIMGTTGVDDVVRCLAQTADGYVYAGGDFTTAAGTTVNRIGRWSGTAWAAIGTGTVGTNGAVYALKDSAYYYLLLGGAFTQAEGATANRIARWSGSAFSTFGSGIGDGTVYAIEGLDNSTLQFAVGGSFNTGTYDYGTYWTGSAFANLMADDFNQAIRAIVRSGVLNYYFGDFTANGTVLDAYSVYSGWVTYSVAMGTGLSAAGHCAAVDPMTGDIYVGGAFTTAGGASAPYMAKWNGSTWSGLNITLPGSPTVTAMAISPDGKKLYVGFDTSGTATGGTGSSTTVTNNGTATAYPVIKIKRAGGTSATLRYIRNATQNATIYSSYAIRDGETLIIDLKDKTVTNDFDGQSVIGAVVERNSDFGRFGLLPGANSITTLVETAGSPTVTAWLEWRTTHWSADGAAA